jgi:hypothetical protein
MTQSIERYTTPEGMVKFLFSPGFGAGWSSWEDNPEFLIFDKGLIELVEKHIELEPTGSNEEAIEAYLKSKGFDYVYLGGLDQLCVCEIPIGTEIKIEEYDGSESYTTRKQDTGWYTA